MLSMALRKESESAELKGRFDDLRSAEGILDGDVHSNSKLCNAWVRACDLRERLGERGGEMMRATRYRPCDE